MLHGYIFDVGMNNQAELFTRAAKKIASHAGHTYKEPQNIRDTIKDVDEITIPMPTERLDIV